jgi:GST-like protein
MGGLGPMLGQNLHFGQYAPEKIPYAIDRYVNESRRLFDVMDKQLTNREFIAGEYSFADMASYPWIFKYPYLQLRLDEFSNLTRWYQIIEQRPAVARAYQIGASINTTPIMTEESKKILLGQSDRSAAA